MINAYRQLHVKATEPGFSETDFIAVLDRYNHSA